MSPKNPDWGFSDSLRAHVGLELTLIGQCLRAPGGPALCLRVAGLTPAPPDKLPKNFYVLWLLPIFHPEWFISGIIFWHQKVNLRGVLGRATIPSTRWVEQEI